MTQPKPLVAALGGLARIAQFFVWRLEWDAKENKYHKYPWNGAHRVDAQQPSAWSSFIDASMRCMRWRAECKEPGVTYALGFMFTRGCGYWFLDVDGCISDGQYSPLVTDWAERLPGCFFEVTSSGRGVHIIGRGELPEHSKRNKRLNAELYTEARGVAFGLSGQAWGCADVEAPRILEIAQQHFAPKVAGPGAEGGWLGPRADWSGPTDDAELLRRAMASASVAAKMGHKATFAQLWVNAPALDTFYGPDTASERDAALAAHLAFWTGCDAPRIERLMRRSALAREKWDKHRTYLRELTIEGACERQKEVFHERTAAERLYGVKLSPPNSPGFQDQSPAQQATAAINTVAPVLPALVVPKEIGEMVDSLLNLVHSSTDWQDVHNRVIPAVRDSGLPPAFMPRLETAINKRLELWDFKLPVRQLRALLQPPRIAGMDAVGDGMGAPEWAARFVYEQQNDRFFDTRTGASMSKAALGAEFDRYMPLKGDGPERQSAAMYLLQHWGCPIVYDTMYDPRQGAIIDWAGRKWANKYTPDSVPEVAPEYTAQGVAAIENFKRHTFLLCGKREGVWMNLLSWMAHVVQFPGKKIRWMPLIKGINGDGKSTIAEVMKAALGTRNLISVGPDVVCNSGGFTDWVHGYAVTVLEEIHITGRERYKVSNMLKPIISNNDVTQNPKGDKPKKVMNTANQLAFTNFNDGVPIEKEDRRNFVIFSPFGSRMQMFMELGIRKAREFFDPIYESLQREPGQWRKWLLEFAIPEWFDPDGEAMATDEKIIMGDSGDDDLEGLIKLVIADGAPGVSQQILSTSCLRVALKSRAYSEGIELDKKFSMQHTLNRIGFVNLGNNHTVHWQGKNHRVWLKAGIAKNNEAIRQLLDATLNYSN